VVLALFYLGLNFSWRQPYFVEKLHIFEYGFLGWLVTRDLNKKKISIKAILLSALFVLLVAGLDEGFQYFLPYRVCDIRDVITDGISGAFGIALCLLKSRL
jgi:VanZ family protein